MTKLGKVLATVINGGTINRAEHPIWHIGRTRDLEKMSSGKALAVHSSQLAVYGWQLAVSSWGLGACSSLMAALGSLMAALDETYGTHETNGDHMTSLLNRKPATTTHNRAANR